MSVWNGWEVTRSRVIRRKDAGVWRTGHNCCQLHSELNMAKKESFETLHDTLWDNSEAFKSICRGIANSDLEYIPADEIKKLKLGDLGFTEVILLIRKEYITAFDTFEEWSSLTPKRSGAVLIGQPGIGVYQS